MSRTRSFCAVRRFGEQAEAYADVHAEGPRFGWLRRALRRATAANISWGTARSRQLRVRARVSGCIARPGPKGGSLEQRQCRSAHDCGADCNQDQPPALEPICKYGQYDDGRKIDQNDDGLCPVKIETDYAVAGDALDFHSRRVGLTQVPLSQIRPADWAPLIHAEY